MSSGNLYVVVSQDLFTKCSLYNLYSSVVCRSPSCLIMEQTYHPNSLLFTMRRHRALRSYFEDDVEEAYVGLWPTIGSLTSRTFVGLL